MNNTLLSKEELQAVLNDGEYDFGPIFSSHGYCVFEVIVNGQVVGHGNGQWLEDDGMCGPYEALAPRDYSEAILSYWKAAQKEALSLCDELHRCMQEGYCLD